MRETHVNPLLVFIIFHVARKYISLFQKCEYRNSIRQRLVIKSDKKKLDDRALMAI